MGNAKRTRTIAVVGFILVALIIWLPTVLHNFAGFVPPTGAQDIGFDFVVSAVWAAFLYAVWNLWRAFRSDQTAGFRGSFGRRTLDVETATRLLEKHRGDPDAALADARDQGYHISRRWRTRAGWSRLAP